MKKLATLEQVNQRLDWLALIIKNYDEQRAPRCKLQTYKTEQAKLIVHRQKLLTPELL